MKPWLMLLAAVALEVTGTAALKWSDGLSRARWLWLVAGGYAGAFALLSLVLRSLPVGVAYAVWSGLGTVGAAAAGRLLFGEAFGAAKVGGVALIIAGVLLLNLTQSAPPAAPPPEGGAHVDGGPPSPSVGGL